MKVSVHVADKVHEGVLIRKDASFLFIRLTPASILAIHWRHIVKIFRSYKGKETEVNVESLRKGR